MSMLPGETCLEGRNYHVLNTYYIYIILPGETCLEGHVLYLLDTYIIRHHE